MNILFVDRADRTVGSSRIWVYDLGDYLKDAGHHVSIRAKTESGGFDVVIFGKGSFSQEAVKKARKDNTRSIIGWINPSISPQENTDETRQRLVDVDFFIVGSIEERDSLLRYKETIVIFPLVEGLYTRIKKHTDHLPIVIGYHGNTDHMEEFHPHVTEAINSLSLEVPLRMIAIHTPNPGWEWTRGRPGIEVEQVPWALNNIEEQLLRCDIGVVPGITPISDVDRDRIVQTSETGYDTDYLIRFKNKSNAGRSFVFHQLHIPVVAAFMPSHFHILGNPDCGFLAHSTEGWLYGLRALASSARTRSRMARAAKAEFDRLYGPKRWTDRLCLELTTLIAQR